jgi:pimeloyl-ACP methyl ester carboxylesterase
VAAASRPDLIRSWTTDIAGAADPEYVWHDLAQIWQRPGEGEALVDAMVGMPLADRVAGFVDAGMTPEAARACAEASDADMGRCILALYRSAAQPAMEEWGRQLEQAERRPGLVIIATADQYTGGEVLARRSAQRFGAEIAVLVGLGHWWMLEDPERGAIAINAFLDSLD